MTTAQRAERSRPVAYSEVRQLGEAQNWHEAGACFGDNDDSMFPETSAGQKLATQRCQLECSVQTLCLQSALDNDERWGVWGGTTEAERERLRRLARQKAEQGRP